jgi:hypothetical protein
MDIKEYENWEKRVGSVALEAQVLAQRYSKMVMVVDYEGPLFQIGFGGEMVKQSSGLVGEGDITAYEDAVDQLKPNHAVVRTLEAIVRQVDNAFIMQGSGVNLIPPEKLNYREYPLLKFASLRCEEVLDGLAMKSRNNREVLSIRAAIPEGSLLVVVNDAEPGTSSHNAVLREIKAANPKTFDSFSIANILVPEYRKDSVKPLEAYRSDVLGAFETGLSAPVEARTLDVKVGGSKFFSPSDFYRANSLRGNVRGE